MECPTPVDGGDNQIITSTTPTTNGSSSGDWLSSFTNDYEDMMAQRHQRMRKLSTASASSSKTGGTDDRSGFFSKAASESSRKKRFDNNNHSNSEHFKRRKKQRSINSSSNPASSVSSSFASPLQGKAESTNRSSSESSAEGSFLSTTIHDDDDSTAAVVVVKHKKASPSASPTLSAVSQVPRVISTLTMTTAADTTMDGASRHSDISASARFSASARSTAAPAFPTDEICFVNLDAPEDDDDDDDYVSEEEDDDYEVDVIDGEDDDNDEENPRAVRRRRRRSRSTSSLPKRNTKVQFQNVEIREYAITIGDSPYCSRGAPISLDWEYSTCPLISVDVYEQESKYRHGRRRRKKTARRMLLDPIQRRDMLWRCGYDLEDIEQAAKAIEKEKFRQSVNLYFLPLFALSEFFASKTEKVFKSKKKLDSRKSNEEKVRQLHQLQQHRRSLESSSEDAELGTMGSSAKGESCSSSVSIAENANAASSNTTTSTTLQQEAQDQASQQSSTRDNGNLDDSERSVRRIYIRPSKTGGGGGMATASASTAGGGGASLEGAGATTTGVTTIGAYRVENDTSVDAGIDQSFRSEGEWSAIGSEAGSIDSRGSFRSTGSLGSVGHSYNKYKIRTDPRQHDKATEIILCSIERPHMRAFHASWFGFFIGFVMWFAITPLLGEVKESLNLTNEEIWTSSLCGSVVTVLARVIMGPLCDVFGARKCMAAIVIVSAIPCGLTGMVQNAAGLSAVRAFIGIAGSAFVPCQYWTSRMFAREVAGTANALVAGWGNLGGGITQLLMGSALFPLFKLIFQGHEDSDPDANELAWRTVFVIPSLIAFMAAYVYIFHCEDSPKGDYAELVRQQQIELVSPFWSLGLAIQNRNVILLLIQYACCFGVEITMTNAIALYMKEEFEQDTAAAAAIASVFGIMNLFARGLGGYGSDFCQARYGTKGRVVWQSFTLFMEGMGIIVFAFAETLVGAIFSLIFMSLWVQCAEGSTYGIVPYVNRRFTGAVVGWIGGGGTLGGVIFSIFFREYDYQKAFIIMGLSAAGSAFLSVFMNTKSLAAIYQEKSMAEHIKNNNNFVFHDDAPAARPSASAQQQQQQPQAQQGAEGGQKKKE